MTQRNHAQNLLVIMSDEHQARALSCAGSFVQTPHLDRLAARGMRFTKAYTPCPICVPARASFATGRYVHETRLWDNAMPYTGATPGWGHALQQAGIPVESIGKLHYRHEGDDSGFDQQHIPMHVVDGIGMVWGSIRREHERAGVDTRMLGPEIGPGESRYTAYDRAVVAKTQAWLHERGQSDDRQPWCLNVGLVAPHFPLIVPQEFYDMYPPDILPEDKLHPRDGHARHPWVELQNALMNSEDSFRDEEERIAAIRTYYALCSWVDHSVGLILQALEDAGLSDTTTVVYTSDHGDNAGARGLWGKSNLYEESAAVPMIMAGVDVPVGECHTPVSLIDLAATILEHFGLTFASSGRNFYDIMNEPEDPDRIVFSEYHAVGSVSGAFMVRNGRWKYNYYVGFEPELFDLEADPEELENLAGHPQWASVRQSMHSALLGICDPEAVDTMAFADQDALIASHGGIDRARTLGAPGATPPPST